MSTSTRRPGRVRLPRSIRPGTRRSQEPGQRLRCLVLADVPDEWIGVDLASGAFVRGLPGLASEGSVRRTVVELEITHDTEPVDPVRPELVVAASPPARVGVARRRPARRLLHRLAAPSRPGATVLGTWGPSIAYVDLSGSDPSVVLLGVPYRSLELSRLDGGGTELAFFYGGVTLHLGVLDVALRRLADSARAGPMKVPVIAAALGFRPEFVLVGLGPVAEGHVRKVVFGLL